MSLPHLCVHFELLTPVQSIQPVSWMMEVTSAWLFEYSKNFAFLLICHVLQVVFYSTDWIMNSPNAVGYKHSAWKRLLHACNLYYAGTSVQHVLNNASQVKRLRVCIPHLTVPSVMWDRVCLPLHGVAVNSSKATTYLTLHHTYVGDFCYVFINSTHIQCTTTYQSNALCKCNRYHFLLTFYVTLWKSCRY